MLARTGRHPWRPAHIHLIVRAPGYRTVATHVFDSASPHLDSDAVFAVKPSLVRDFARRPADDPDRPPSVEGEWYSVENDVVLVSARRALVAGRAEARCGRRVTSRRAAVRFSP